MSDAGMRLPSDRVRDEARAAIEAIVLVAEEPLDPNLIAQLLELAPAIVEELCRQLAAEYEDEGRGFQLVRVAGGWRYQTHPDQAAYVERFVLEGQTAKLSNAALETLAIVAYKQPISRAQVAAIRGVSVDGVMRTLQQRGYIDEIARDPGPGQAVLFGTTRMFLEQLGLDGLEELPALGDFVPRADVIEQLEQGLRPDGMSDPARFEGFDIEGGGARGEDDDDPFADEDELDMPARDAGDLRSAGAVPDSPAGLDGVPAGPGGSPPFEGSPPGGPPPPPPPPAPSISRFGEDDEDDDLGVDLTGGPDGEGGPVVPPPPPPPPSGHGWSEGAWSPERPESDGPESDGPESDGPEWPESAEGPDGPTGRDG
jgi:segregation and condensation protein B